LNFFETPHKLNAKHLSEMHDFEYFAVQNENELQQVWKAFYNEDNKPRLLEIFTPRELNAEVLKNYFNSLK
jgi:2-succinyl-5-enolpyruvyl-6-hydroxy-3-cyclohexene-1-carboxylate synthase